MKQHKALKQIRSFETQFNHQILYHPLNGDAAGIAEKEEISRGLPGQYGKSAEATKASALLIGSSFN
jgi:hypothetical protein